MYLARLDFTGTQTVILTLRKRVAATETLLIQQTTDLTHVADARYAMRFQVVGTTLRAKAWAVAQREPSMWQVETTDTSLSAAGQIGMRSILSTLNTNVLPVTVSWGGLPCRRTAAVHRDPVGQRHRQAARGRCRRPGRTAGRPSTLRRREADA